MRWPYPLIFRDAVYRVREHFKDICFEVHSGILEDDDLLAAGLGNLAAKQRPEGSNSNPTGKNNLGSVCDTASELKRRLGH